MIYLRPNSPHKDPEESVRIAIHNGEYDKKQLSHLININALPCVVNHRSIICERALAERLSVVGVSTRELSTSEYKCYELDVDAAGSWLGGEAKNMIAINIARKAAEVCAVHDRRPLYELTGPSAYENDAFDDAYDVKLGADYGIVPWEVRVSESMVNQYGYVRTMGYLLSDEAFAVIQQFVRRWAVCVKKL